MLGASLNKIVSSLMSDYNFISFNPHREGWPNIYTDSEFNRRYEMLKYSGNVRLKRFTGIGIKKCQNVPDQCYLTNEPYSS